MPGQRTVQATLGELAQIAAENHRQTAILVVGPVTALREHLRWFDARPLFGRRIVVTRSREQAGELVDLLEERGAEAISAPAIRILPVEDTSALDRACADAGSYDWIVFTSANGVDFFMNRLLAGRGDVRDLKGVRICTIGPSTAARLGRWGIKVDLTPPVYRAEAIVESLKRGTNLNGVRVLLPRADIARELLAEELRNAGARVKEVAAYRTVLASPEGDGEYDVYRMLLERQIHAVTFTSASTVRNFVKMLGEDPAVDLLRTTAVACIGPVTAEAAQKLGIETTIMPSSYTIPALVDAIVEHFGKARPAEAGSPT
jgi:uroporphyrinogen III methyltransferase/synthase